MKARYTGKYLHTKHDWLRFKGHLVTLTGKVTITPRSISVGIEPDDKTFHGLSCSFKNVEPLDDEARVFLTKLHFGVISEGEQ